MKVKTSELIGPALNWAVTKCEGYEPITHTQLATIWVERINARGVLEQKPLSDIRYSTNWKIAGPIIERENISIVRCDDDYQNFPDKWLAERGANSYSTSTEHQSHDEMIQFYVDSCGEYGPTPLVAAMRCYVASKMGDEIEIPEELK